jgi:hypothetical protein
MLDRDDALLAGAADPVSLTPGSFEVDVWTACRHVVV